MTPTDIDDSGLAGPRLGPGRRLLLPGAMTAVMLALLLGLGFWQVRRLAWKTALLARIDSAERAPGVPLGPTLENFTPENFTKVRVAGTLRRDVGRYGSEVRDTPRGELIGTQIVAVLDRAGGPPLVTLLGWAPTADSSFVVPSGPAEFDGYVRAPDRPGLFSPRDDPAARLFYTLDPASIGPALGVAHPAPFTLVLLGRATTGAYPMPAERLPRPPNDHLGYAVTWFGLAATLLVVFVLYARKALRA